MKEYFIDIFSKSKYSIETKTNLRAAIIEEINRHYISDDEIEYYNNLDFAPSRCGIQTATIKRDNVVIKKITISQS